MNSTNIAVVILLFFRFVFTPGLLIGTTIWAATLTSARTIRIYAFWLGIFIGILVIVLNLLTTPDFVFVPNASASFAPNSAGVIVDILVGLAAGGGAMAITRFLNSAKVASLVITAVSAAGLIGYTMCLLATSYVTISF